MFTCILVCVEILLFLGVLQKLGQKPQIGCGPLPNRRECNSTFLVFYLMLKRLIITSWAWYSVTESYCWQQSFLVELVGRGKYYAFPLCSFRWLLSPAAAPPLPFWEQEYAVMHLIFKSSLPWGQQFRWQYQYFYLFIYLFSPGRLYSCGTGCSKKGALWSSLETLCGMHMPQDACNEQWPKTLFLPLLPQGKKHKNKYLDILVSSILFAAGIQLSICSMWTKAWVKAFEKAQFYELWIVFWN